MVVIQRRRTSDPLLPTRSSPLCSSSSSLPETTKPEEAICPERDVGEKNAVLRPLVPLCATPSSPRNTTLRRLSSNRCVPTGSPDHPTLSYSSDNSLHPKLPAEKQTTTTTTPLRKRPSYSIDTSSDRTRTLLWRAIYTVAVLIWIGSCWHRNTTKSLQGDLETLLEGAQEAPEGETSKAGKLELQVKELQGRLDKMTKMNRAFERELRMIGELPEEDDDEGNVVASSSDSKKMISSSTRSPRESDSSAVLTKWIRQRRSGLEHRVQILKKMVQENSKAAVLSKFGPGPYRVKFTVHVLYNSEQNGFASGPARDQSVFSKNRGMRIKRDFVVELAPLDEMPHAIHLFLELVSSRLWDDTVFLHQDESEHVMAVAPVDYDTHQLKANKLAEIEFQSLGFPEYSSKHPHEKYTLGFANLGPTFYINTLDNSDHHGPGGQNHHLLPDVDADPCFGTVIQGREVVDTLMETGIQADNMLNPKAAHPWKGQEDMFWTRIISVDLL